MRLPANQGLAIGVGVSTPCEAVWIAWNDIFVPGSSELQPSGSNYDPGMGPYSPRVLENFRVFLRVMTRPAGQVTGCSKCHGSVRVGSGRVQTFTGLVVSGQEVFKSRGSGQVGSRLLQISRVGSGQDFFKSHGSGQVGSKGDEKLTGRVRS